MEQQIIEKIDVMIKKIEDVEKRIECLEKSTKHVRKSCSKMDNHINFIDSIYMSIRRPLDYICSKFGNNTDTLPSSTPLYIEDDVIKIE